MKTFAPLVHCPERRPEQIESLEIHGQGVPLRFVYHRRARRYILRVMMDGWIRITIPRGGTPVEGEAFARRQSDWIQKQLVLRTRLCPVALDWIPGHEFLYRGEKVIIKAIPDTSTICFGDQALVLATFERDLRPAIENRLRSLAARELPLRTMELAAQHGLKFNHVCVRNQRSRWGSCSIRRTISLNWRLIQTPDWVRDYIITHELMHLREMNHSARFWSAVESAFPRLAEAECWLKTNSSGLRQ